jgi:GDPmannose 4,6-dehydratase
LAKRAIITGISGQDGALLARYLLTQGYEIWGGTRETSLREAWRLNELGILSDIHTLNLDLTDGPKVIEAIASLAPDEIYNLAGQSFVADSFRQPLYSSQVNAMGALYILEAIRTCNPNVRFYQASSSEMYGNNGQTIQNETSTLIPSNPYAYGKCFSHWMTINYRKAYNLFAASGILFSHESSLRSNEFVTRKITQGFARIKANEIPFIELGAVDAQRDWGHAEDYVRGMYLMLQQHVADDYVLASGECHSIRDFVNLAASICGWQAKWVGEGVDQICIDEISKKLLVKINPAYLRSWEVPPIKGDSTKAKAHLHWTPINNFESLVSEMMEQDLRRVCGHS